MAEPQRYPFIPKSNAELKPGQFWGIRLSDGRFACGRVLRLSEPLMGLRNLFVAGLLDWVGPVPPTPDAIAGAPLLEFRQTPIEAIQAASGILGYRDLDSDGIVAPKDEDIKHIWGPGFLQSRAEHRFVKGNPPPKFSSREVRSPLTEEMLSPFPTPEGSVVLGTMLTDPDFMRLADWFRAYPQLSLRVGSGGKPGGSITDLEFLRFFPFIRHFGAVTLFHSLQSIEGLRHLSPDLESLDIGATKHRLDLRVLERFPGLKWLSLEGQTKGIAAISKLTAMEDLTLQSITLPDLSLLLPMKELRALDIKLGGTKDLGLLPRIGKLEYLELWMVKGLTDLSAVGRLPHLRYLFLQALRRVEALPDLSMDKELRRVHLETMKGLRDLRPLATAPALEQLLLIDMRHLQPEDLRPLVGLPNLKGVDIGLGSDRKNNAARTLLQLPEATQATGGWRDV